MLLGEPVAIFKTSPEQVL